MLEEHEQILRKSLNTDFWRMAHMKKSLSRQKFRILWVKDEDENSKFFHAMINARRRTNAIFGLHVEGVCVDDPNLVQGDLK